MKRAPIICAFALALAYCWCDPSLSDAKIAEFEKCDKILPEVIEAIIRILYWMIDSIKRFQINYSF
jgi:hypothetical protein